MTEAAALAGAFADPATEAAVAFRSLMGAMARPGTVEQVSGATPPAPLSVAAGVAILVLCDPDTPLHLAGLVDCPAVRSWVAFHTGSPIVSAEACRFAVGPWEALHPLDRFAVGTPEYPDRSATLIVEMPEVSRVGARLTGPGIADEASVTLPEVAAFQSNARLFPLGLDFFLTAGADLAAMPRTTKVG